MTILSDSKSWYSQWSDYKSDQAAKLRKYKAKSTPSGFQGTEGVNTILGKDRYWSARSILLHLRGLDTLRTLRVLLRAECLLFFNYASQCHKGKKVCKVFIISELTRARSSPRVCCREQKEQKEQIDYPICHFSSIFILIIYIIYI